MPHLIVEYSANIEQALNLPVLMRGLKERAVETGVFPLGGIRVRAARRDAFDIADGDADNAFVHLQARIGAGRDEATRNAAADEMIRALSQLKCEGVATTIPMHIEILGSEAFRSNNYDTRAIPGWTQE